MTGVGRGFRKGLGKPASKEPNGIKFTNLSQQEVWKLLYRDVGAGWYLDGFVYLFGPEVHRLQRCLDAWSFLVPPNHPDRTILGRNAYGAILVLENGNSPIHVVRVLEPYVVTYWTDPVIRLENLLGWFLPEREIPYFLDDELYRQYVSLEGKLPKDIILAPKIPRDLGGRRTLANFQPENIFEYYESTAPIYAKLAAEHKHD